jgi:hypothetical protein
MVLRFWAAFLFLGVCSAGTALDPFRPDLKRTLETWQQRLHFETWTVAIEVVDDRTLGGQAMGDIHWNLNARTAAIRILRERDYDLPAESSTRSAGDGDSRIGSPAARLKPGSGRSG